MLIHQSPQLRKFKRRSPEQQAQILTVLHSSIICLVQGHMLRRAACFPWPWHGTTGFVHWRIDLTGISATTWSDPENGGGPTVTNVPLGPSFAESSSTSPLAVLDSGGVQILVSRRGYADSIYSAFGVSASSDGLCKYFSSDMLSFL
jgi:hypothetical protein